MDIKSMFGKAIWVTLPASSDGSFSKFQILRRKLFLAPVKKATLRVVGLGFFHCYINGKPVSEDLFLPLNTDYEPRDNWPIDEVLTGHRLYVPQFDVTDLLSPGENTLAIHFGGGWYTVNPEGFGTAKAIWRIFGETEDGDEFDFCSSQADRVSESYILNESRFPQWEGRDYTGGINEAALAPGYDDSAWAKAAPAIPVETDYLFSDCPADRVTETLMPTLLKKDGCTALYDAGRNTTGWPVLLTFAEEGQTVTVSFCEELDKNGNFNDSFCYGQVLKITSDGGTRAIRPEFIWFGFRYFKVEGAAEPVSVEVVHTAANKTADFTSSSELLNWIHSAYVNTQLSNMHTGIPSDCPHIERRGYTGDGQLTCHAAMNILDAKSFYKKWIGDILDCQDEKTGHIQYTAPYLRSGGGPGGWGCAIVEVPYQVYRHYGDTEPIARCYPAMKKYFEYLEAHSENGLIVSDKAGEWCLGDWCPPIQVILPAPFVNNYFYVKSLGRAVEIARVLGFEADIPLFEERIAARKKAIVNAYYNSWDGNFVGNMQGANAFALDIGLGDGRTYENLARRYAKLKAFDTGIFGTDIVTRVLFEHGDGDIAFDLLNSTTLHSFGEMKRLGATTVWEYWPGSLDDRSHNHPMFGAVAAYLYDYILGIQSIAPGGSELVISPAMPRGLSSASGWRTLPAGVVSVAYLTENGKADFKVDLPQGIKASFVFGDKTFPLASGENCITFEV